MASCKKRGGKWWIRWRDDGDIHRSITVSNEREALRLKVEIEDSIERTGRYEPRRPRRAHTQIGVVLTDFVLDCTRRYRPNTIRAYSRKLEAFKRWFEATTPVDKLSFATLSAYQLHLIEAKKTRTLHSRNAQTVKRHIELVEQVWEWAWRRQARGDYAGVPQPDSLELTGSTTPHKLAPTWEQMDKVIAQSFGWHRRLLVVLRCTGLRVQQAMGLQWEDLHQDGRDGWSLHVRPELGKTAQERRGRFIPIAPVLAAEIAGWGRREGFLIPCDQRRADGTPYRFPVRTDRAIAAWKAAGIERQIWARCPHHAFRAGFQSGLNRLGANLEAVEFLVGHSRGIREHYVGPDALPMVAAVALVPALGTTSNVQALKRRRKADDQ